jgi:hypothetical protein
LFNDKIYPYIPENIEVEYKNKIKDLSLNIVKEFRVEWEEMKKIL